MKKLNLSVIIALFAIVGLNSCSDEARPFIDPPFPHLNPEYKDYSFNADDGGFLEYKTGTTITVPKGIWVDAQGNKVTGNIKIKYREYHNAVDIFLSGAPMAYDTAGVKENLTTAGMFEIRAYDNDSSEIFIRNGEKLTVRMASYNSEDNYNFYSLNENEKKWNYKGTAKPEVNKKIAEITDTITKIEENIKKLKPEYKFPFEKDKFFALNNDDMLDVYYGEKYNLIRKNRKSKKPQRKAETYGLSWYDVYSRKDVYFRGVKFTAAQIAWENVSGKKLPYWIKKSAGIEKLTRINKDTFYMQFYSNKKKSAFYKVRSVIPIKYLFKYPPETWQENFDKIEAEIEKERLRIIEEEKLLAVQASVFRTFDVNNTGLHNWDRVYHRSDKILVKSNFKFDIPKDELDDVYETMFVYYFIDNNKSFVKIDLSSTDTLMLIPDNTAKLIAVISDKKAAIFSSSDYKKINFEKLKNSNDYAFNMKTINVKSKEEFLKFLE